MATTTTNIKINIVEPGSSTPVDDTTNTTTYTTTSTDISTPETGLFTHGIGGTEATIIGSALFLVLSSIIVTILYKKHIRQGKVTKLVHIINQCKTVFTSKKRITASLSALALLASAGTLAILLANSGKSNTNAAEGDTENSLTVTESSEDLTIEVGDSPVFAVLPVELTVEEATQAGYTITAYTDSISLVSTTDPDNIIPMVTLSEPIEPNEEGVGKGWSPVTTLANNTWGLSLEQPQDQNSEVYTTLSIDQDNPTILKSIDDYSETEENDTTTIYYGFYITPDVPKGIYEGSVINYAAEPNYITNLSFNGNGNDGEEDMGSIIIPAGTAIALPENTYAKDGYTFVGWNTVANPTDQDPGESYTDQSDFTASSTTIENITLYATWIKTISNLTYMQDFKTLSAEEKSGVLRSMTEDEQYQLKDIRDQKQYYISKLKDGNVWMTQNLDLDLNNQTTLTPENTNIGANWTPANSTINSINYEVDGWLQNEYYVVRSADPGGLYIYSSGNNRRDEQYSSLEACQTVHSDCSAHNHAGNYYSWSAAVANNDASNMTEQFSNAGGSICPAGWRLPTGRQSNGDPLEGNELGTILDSYDILGDAIKCGITCVYYEYADGGLNKIRTAPLWLTRSASVYQGSLDGTGNYGGYWSSTVYGSDSAFYLSFGSASIDPNSNINRYYGYPIRCLAE